MIERNCKPFLLTVYGNEGINMEKIKTITCEKCGNSVSQQQLPNGDAYYCCHYCGFTSGCSKMSTIETSFLFAKKDTNNGKQ